MREVSMTSILEDNKFFERSPWFKFKNLELALGMALKFNSSVAKVLN